MKWRESKGINKGSYGALHSYKPIVAIGAEHPLEDEELVADHFRKAESPLTVLIFATEII